MSKVGKMGGDFSSLSFPHTPPQKSSSLSYLLGCTRPESPAHFLLSLFLFLCSSFSLLPLLLRGSPPSLSQTLVGYEMKYSPLEKTSYSFSVCNSEATSLYYMLCWPMQSNSWLVWILSNTCLRSQH